MSVCKLQVQPSLIVHLLLFIHESVQCTMTLMNLNMNGPGRCGSFIHPFAVRLLGKHLNSSSEKCVEVCLRFHVPRFIHASRARELQPAASREHARYTDASKTQVLRIHYTNICTRIHAFLSQKYARTPCTRAIDGMQDASYTRAVSPPPQPLPTSLPCEVSKCVSPAAQVCATRSGL